MFGRNIVAPSVFSTDLPSSVSSSYNHRSRHNPGTSSKTLHEVQEYGVPPERLKDYKHVKRINRGNFKLSGKLTVAGSIYLLS